MHLFTVTEAYMISDTGVVVGPVHWEQIRAVKPGSRIKLVRPDGTTRTTSIQGIASSGLQERGDLLLSVDVTKAEVPVGTEVWLDE